MGWGGEQKLSSGGLKNFRVCSLRSVMRLSRGGKADSERGVSLSQSLCPPLCSSGSEGKKEAPATDSDLPPEYYQKAYFFEDNDSDDQSVSDISPLIRRPTTQSSPSPRTHIVTGYLSAVEALLLIIYVGSLVGLTAGSHHGDKTCSYSPLKGVGGDSTSTFCPDRMVAYFGMIHVLVWVVVGVFDRIVQWRHQVLRRKGYLKFYRKMKNVRRIPFVIVSLANAVIMLFVCLLYIFRVEETWADHGLHAVDFLYIIVGVEVILSLPCLVYYIVRATLFNCAQQPPDVIQDTYSGTTSPTASVTAVGFRDGEDLDELLERQADMIRYLQQHNANLGRRILELQSQAME